MSEINNTLSQISQEQYNVLNKDVEICGEYFDIVPDGNLCTKENYPIFAIRMRPLGINHIMVKYKYKYNFDTDVLTYKLHTKQYTLYSDNSMQMYITQRDNLLKFFNFDSCANNQFKGIIIVITNEDDRMIHAIPFLYGVVDNKKKIIFLDPFCSPDLGSGCIIGADFFYREYKGDIDCYCHGKNIQADHHSCGIIACDFVKNCLKNNFKLAYRILKNVNMRVEINNPDTNTVSVVNIFDLPDDLKKFSQIKVNKIYNEENKNNKTDEKSKQLNNWFSFHIRKLLYRRDPEPYDPTNKIIPEQEGQIKDINTALLEKGHKYAGQIVKDLKQKTSYNSKYWLNVIRSQNNNENILKKLFKIAKKITHDV